MSVKNEVSLSKNTARSMAWVATEKWSGKFLGLITFVILSRVLAPESFGMIAIASSIISILSVFAESGLAQTIIQKSVIDNEDINSAFWLSCLISSATYIICLLLTPALVLIYKEPALYSILPIIGLLVLVGGISSVPAALLERDFNYKALTIRKLTGNLAGALSAIFLALKGYGVWALIAQPLASSVVSAIILWKSLKWRPELKFCHKRTSSSLKVTSNIIAVELLSTLQAHTDKLVIGLYFNTEILGFYYFGQKMLTLVNEIISSVFSKVSLSTFSRVQFNRDKLSQHYLSLTFISAAVASPIFGYLVVFGESITTLVYGNGWSESVIIMCLMAPSALIATVTYFDKSIFIATGNSSVSLRISLGQFTISTALLIASLPFGILAVAASRTARQLLFWPVRMLAVRKITKISIANYLQQILGPFMGFIIIVAVGYKIEAASPTLLSSQPMASLIIHIVALGILYLLTISLLSRKQARNIANSFRDGV